MEEKKKSSKIMFIILGIVIAVLIGVITFLVLKLNNNTKDLNNNESTTNITDIAKNNNENTANLTDNNEIKVPIATMDIKDYGTVKIELYPDIAPKTVENFINLSNNGFYDNLTFHRVVKDFMIQGGDKNGDGTGKVTLNDLYNNGINSEYTIEGEFEANGYKNSLKHTEGIISMARTDYSNFPNADETLIKEGYNSASSQFFIVTKNAPSLDGYYASFGKVIEGMNIIHKIENIQTEETEYGEKSKPVDPPVIEKIRVEMITGTNNITTNNTNIDNKGDLPNYISRANNYMTFNMTISDFVKKLNNMSTYNISPIEESDFTYISDVPYENGITLKSYLYEQINPANGAKNGKGIVLQIAPNGKVASIRYLSKNGIYTDDVLLQRILNVTVNNSKDEAINIIEKAKNNLEQPFTSNELHFGYQYWKANGIPAFELFAM